MTVITHGGMAAGSVAFYAGAVSDDGGRPPRVEDVHELALAMPYVTVEASHMKRDEPGVVMPYRWTKQVEGGRSKVT